MQEADPSNVGALVRRHRERHGLTQEELAEATGARLSVGTISNIERGRVRPYRHTLEVLAQALGLPATERAALFARWREDVPAPSATAHFAATSHLADDPHGLFAPLTPMIGRERELDEITRLLVGGTVRLLTLMGPGGVGKTRLAQHAAERVAGAFPDGIIEVPLAPLRDSMLLLPTLAQALGVRDGGEHGVRQRLVAVLREKALLLVLDNVEQIVAAAPDIVGVLGACPRVTALVTSRAPLHVRGERVYDVRPLAVPVAGRRAGDDILAEVPAVALFVERARAVRPDAVATDADLRAVADICIRLDGLPLAIELAAAQVRLLPPAALLTRLDHRLHVLVNGARDLPERQHTLRATLDWSFDLLELATRALFRRLSVFVGGAGLAAAESVCRAPGASLADAPMDDAEGGVLAGLGALVDQNLVRVIETDGGANDEPRVTMLETIREYARERLIESGEEAELRRRHALTYLDLAERVAPLLQGTEHALWLARIEREHDNLRAALRWVEETGELALGFRFATALWWFWFEHGHLGEGQRWVEALLALEARTVADGAPRVGLAERAMALRILGVLTYFQGDYTRAGHLHAQSGKLYKQLGDMDGYAAAIHNLALVASVREDYIRAQRLFERSIELGDALGKKAAVANALANLGEAACGTGEIERARALLEQSLALGEQLNLSWVSGGARILLGQVATRAGDGDEALMHFRAALAIWQVAGNPRGIADGLEGIAVVVSMRGGARLAARLMGTAAALRDATGIARRVVARRDYDTALANAQAALGDAAFTDAWAEGYARTPEDTITEAVALVPGSGEQR